jgi:hypothetical protein
MNQLWQFDNKSEEEINAEIEENVSNNTKKSPFGSNSQGCIHLLKIIAGITSGITDTISTSAFHCILTVSLSYILNHHVSNFWK